MRSPPNPYQSLASEMKQTFLSTNLACLLAFEQWAAGPYHILSITVSSRLTFFFFLCFCFMNIQHLQSQCSMENENTCVKARSAQETYQKVGGNPRTLQLPWSLNEEIDSEEGRVMKTWEGFSERGDVVEILT